MFQFEIHGPPIPQKQTRFSCINNKPHSWDPSKQDKERIQWQVRPFAPTEPVTGPIRLDITFYLPIPKSASSKMKLAMSNQTVLPVVKPDIDNLAYIVTNALKGLVYKDDNQIVEQRLKKFYSHEPRTVIQVHPIEQSQKVGFHADDL